MSSRFGVARAFLAFLLVTLGASALPAQTQTALRNDLKARGPLLDRPAGLVVRGVTLETALTVLTETSGVVVVFSPSLLRVENRTVTCECRQRSVGEALDVLLAGTLFSFSEMGGQVALLPKTMRPPVIGEPAGHGWLASAHEPVRPVVGRRATPTRDGGAAAGPSAAAVQPAGTIVGRVVDALTDNPVFTARVEVVDTRLGDLTDEGGRYRITGIPAGEVQVRVQRIGYATQTRAVTVGDGLTTTLDFALEPSASRLDEIVVTATGQHRRLELGNVVGNIDAEQVVGTAPITSLGNLLNARVPGVDVGLTSGGTGMSPRIRIRGANSISLSNDPLVIVDGARVDASPGSSGGASALYGLRSGRLNDLNPHEIESIEIMKGPSAATLYGTDAANGVIVVTTRRGSPAAPSWTTYADVGLTQPVAPSMDNYHSWGTDAQGNARQCLLVQAGAGVCEIESLSTFNPLRHPETSPLTTGRRYQVGMQVRGGTELLTYFVSADREQETGHLRMPASEVARIQEERAGSPIPSEQLRPNWRERSSVRGNLGLGLGRARVNLSSGLVFSETQIPQGSWTYAGAAYGRGYRDEFDGWWGNPVPFRPGEAYAHRGTERMTRYTGSLSSDWRLADWLTTRAVVGADLAATHFDGLQRRGEGLFGVGRTNGQRLNERANAAIYTGDLLATATLPLRPGLAMRTTVGVQYNRRTHALTSVTAFGLSPGSTTVTGAAVIDGSESSVETVIAGGYIEETVAIDDRLFLTAAVRWDGASAFGRDFETATYPKASASWLAVSGASGFLNELRLRSAYGASGVQPGSVDALARMSVSTVLVDGAPATGAGLTAIGNPDLRPERQTELEVGADAELSGGRLRAEATYYHRLSKDALIQTPLSSEFGIGSRWENIGAVRNSGVEGLLWIRALDRPGLSWDATLTGSLNRNELKRLGLDEPSLGGASQRHVEGYPLFGRWARPILSYHDANGNGIIEPSEIVVGDEEVFVGPSLPPYLASLVTTVGLLGDRLRISTMLDYRGGHVILNSSEQFRCTPGIQNCRGVNDPDASFFEQARAVAWSTPALGMTSYGYMEKGDFVRWRELSLSVDLPARVLRYVGARSGTVAVTGRNLAVFTSYSGLDPEVQTGGGPLSEGYEDLLSPLPSRYWLLRLTLTH